LILEDIFTDDILVGKFSKPVVIKKFNRSDLSYLVSKYNPKLVAASLAIWHQIVHKRFFSVNPMALQKYIQESDPNINLRIDRIIGTQSIKELFFLDAEVEDTSLENKECAQLLLILTHANELLLSDVTFANPYKEIKNSPYAYQFYEGLGLLPLLMERIDQYCILNNIR
jgi:hypothetical protein